MSSKTSAEFNNGFARYRAEHPHEPDPVAFNNYSATVPHLVKAMHHAPPVGAARAAISTKLRHEFRNDGASDGISVGMFPQELFNALGLTPDDSAEIITSKIAQAAPGLPPRLAQLLWSTIIAAFKKKFGDAVSAAAKASSLLPQLCNLLNTSSASGPSDASFANASAAPAASPKGHQLLQCIPVDLRKSLKLENTSDDNDVKDALNGNLGGLNAEQLQRLAVAAISIARAIGGSGSALGRANNLFPKLFAALGTTKT